jgi:hypothetical protein
VGFGEFPALNFCWVNNSETINGVSTRKGQRFRRRVAAAADSGKYMGWVRNSGRKRRKKKGFRRRVGCFLFCARILFDSFFLGAGGGGGGGVYIFL